MSIYKKPLSDAFGTTFTVLHYVWRKNWSIKLNVTALMETVFSQNNYSLAVWNVSRTRKTFHV